MVTVINSFWGLTNLPALYINKLLIDIVVNNIGKSDWVDPIKNILLILFVRFIIDLSRSVLSRINMAYSDQLTSQINDHVEKILAEKINTLDIPTVESSDFQDQYKKIERESGSRVWNMVSPISDIPNAIFTLASGIAPIFIFNPLIGLLVVIVRIPEIIANTKVAKLDYELSEKLSQKWRIWGWISYHLTNIKHLYENNILGNSAYLIKKLAGVQNEVRQAQFERRMTRAKLRNLADIPNNILLLALNSYFFILAIIGKISLGTAQLLYQAANTLGNGFAMLVNSGVRLYENYLFVQDLSEFLSLETKHPSGHKPFPKNITSGLEFRHVWFKYPNSPDWILKDINLQIKSMENIALIGENGAGKSTLIKLLVGFYRPDRGEILIDGININNYDQQEYWKNIGVLFQDFSQYPFTARESIGYGDVSRINSLNEIREAAKLTDIDSFISRLPLGYDNPLTKEFDQGIEPSKGQWQRIALSRTLFRKSQIIILDEPTSNVDPQAEENIFNQILTLGRKKIIVLVSHRFNTVRQADRILVIKDGQVSESGSHNQLLKLKGTYSHLFSLQAKSYK